MSLAKRTAVVTGSTSGIGLAYARALAAEGADVLINGFGDKDAIEKERSGIEKDFGVKCVYDGADMSKPAEIAAMIAHAEKALGSVDVLVNNAGIQFVRPSRISRSRNGTRSLRSTCPPPSIRSARPCPA